MRRYLVILWIFLLLPGSTNIVWAKHHNLHFKLIETRETQVGEIIFLKLPGNPSIGYKYRFNRELSTGLHLVSVDLLGWLMTSKSRTIFFSKRDVMNVAVRTISPGKADLAFDYYRPLGGRTYTTTYIVRVAIKPRLAAQ